MQNIIMFSTFGVSIFTIVYSLFLASGISLKSAGSKKLFDISKIIADEQKKKAIKNIKDFALVAVVLFTGIIYAFGWQAAVSFLAGAVIFALIDHYLMTVSAKVSVRSAEAAKTDAVFAYKLNYILAAVATYLMAGSGLLIFAIINFILKDSICLISLALSAVVVSIFTWRGGRQNYLGAFVGILAAVIVLTKSGISSYKNVELLPLMFVSFILLISLVSKLLSGVNSTKLNVSSAMNRAVIFVSILTLAAAYFGPRYILEVSGAKLIIKLAATLVLGLVLGLIIIYTRQFSKILPTIAVALTVLIANYLVGNYGITLAALGFLSLWPLLMLANLFSYSIKNAEAIAVAAEIPQTAVENIKTLDSSKIRTSGYFITLFGILAVTILIYYFAGLSSLKFLATDPKLISGLLFGGAASYILSSELFVDKILKIAVAIIGVVIAGVTLGPIFLAGVIAGAILIDLLVSQSVSCEVLIMAIIAVFSSTFIETQYSLIIRGIIAGGTIFLVATYFIIKMLYAKRIQVGK
ncbi:MAG: sodium/proton-translocating pyrophosphatase [Candidatus Berkelbacteria bacterium]|nr:sodium/proton-translocating pyrophosphatase [Candidatus Berkelbacteria bacterium]